MVNKVDSKTLGHKNSIPLEPYLKWVRNHAQSLVMPDPTIRPIIMEPVAEGDTPYTILHPDMPTDFKELQRSWIQLHFPIHLSLNYYLLANLQTTKERSSSQVEQRLSNGI